MSLGEIEHHLGLDLGQILGYRDIGHRLSSFRLVGIEDGFGENTLLSSDLDLIKTAHDGQCANDIIDLISMNFSRIFILIFNKFGWEVYH